MLSLLEAEALGVLKLVREAIAPGRTKMSNLNYMELMKNIRNMIVRLENKMFGCPKGLHATSCACSEYHIGKNVHALKEARKKSLKRGL